LAEQIAQLIAKGMTEEQACIRVGVNLASFRTARRRNSEFEAAVKEAHAQYLDESLDMIGKGQSGWQGRAWILERRHGDQFRRNSGLEVSATIAPFSAADVLVRKPPHQWSTFDIDQSIGAWKLLKKFSPEQLEQLLDLYQRHWGLMAEWSDQQLEWGAEIEKCLGEARSKEAAELLECEVSPNGQEHALIHGSIMGGVG
jgi:hypothetical protein